MSRPIFANIDIFIPPSAAHLYDSVVLYAKVNNEYCINNLKNNNRNLDLYGNLCKYFNFQALNIRHKEKISLDF